jgi:curved DNA-binding protein CbpA
VERSLYDVLDVDPEATPEEIRRAYLHRARLAHPDAGGSEAGMKEVNLAWEVLGDPERRHRYNREREPVADFDDAPTEAPAAVDDPTDDRPLRPPIGGLSVLAVVAVAMFVTAVGAFSVAVALSSRPLLGASAALLILASVMMVALPFAQMTRTRRR